MNERGFTDAPSGPAPTDAPERRPRLAPAAASADQFQWQPRMGGRRVEHCQTAPGTEARCRNPIGGHLFMTSLVRPDGEPDVRFRRGRAADVGGRRPPTPRTGGAAAPEGAASARRRPLRLAVAQLPQPGHVPPQSGRAFIRKSVLLLRLVLPVGRDCAPS